MTEEYHISTCIACIYTIISNVRNAGNSYIQTKSISTDGLTPTEKADKYEHEAVAYLVKRGISRTWPFGSPNHFNVIGLDVDWDIARVTHRNYAFSGVLLLSAQEMGASYPELDVGLFSETETLESELAGATPYQLMTNEGLPHDGWFSFTPGLGNNTATNPTTSNTFTVHRTYTTALRDYYINQTITFTSGPLSGLSTVITDVAASGIYSLFTTSPGLGSPTDMANPTVNFLSTSTIYGFGIYLSSGSWGAEQVDMDDVITRPDPHDNGYVSLSGLEFARIYSCGSYYNAPF